MALYGFSVYTKHKQVEIFSSRKTKTSKESEAMKSTFEMDGLFTQDDIDNRFYVMGQCLNCDQWNRFDNRDYKYKCSNCSSEKWNLRESRSIRTWLTTKDTKTKRTRAKRNAA